MYSSDVPPDECYSDVLEEDAPLWVQIRQVTGILDRALLEMRNRGVRYAEAEGAYQAAKAKRALVLSADGMTATMISMCIKGDDEVNGLLVDRMCAETLYASAKEAVNVYKKKLDTLREQYEREWSNVR